MLPERYFRKGSYRTIWIRPVLALVALLSLLAARNVLPHFPRATGAYSVINADSHHDQRPRFDHSSSQWSAPAEVFLPTPRVADAPNLTPAPQLFSTLQAKGFHYNRPPPIS
jgi:hypothetical protein